MDGNVGGMGDIRSRNVWNLCPEMHPNKKKKKKKDTRSRTFVLSSDGGHFVPVAKEGASLPPKDRVQFIEEALTRLIPAIVQGTANGQTQRTFAQCVFGHRSRSVEITKRVVLPLSSLSLFPLPLLSSFSPLLISLARLFVQLRSTSLYLFLYIPSFLPPHLSITFDRLVCLVPRSLTLAIILQIACSIQKVYYNRIPVAQPLTPCLRAPEQASTDPNKRTRNSKQKKIARSDS